MNVSLRKLLAGFLGLTLGLGTLPAYALRDEQRVEGKEAGLEEIEKALQTGDPGAALQAASAGLEGTLSPDQVKIVIAAGTPIVRRVLRNEVWETLRSSDNPLAKQIDVGRQTLEVLPVAEAVRQWGFGNRPLATLMILGSESAKTHRAVEALAEEAKRLSIPVVAVTGQAVHAVGMDVVTETDLKAVRDAIDRHVIQRLAAGLETEEVVGPKTDLHRLLLEVGSSGNTLVLIPPGQGSADSLLYAVQVVSSREVSATEGRVSQGTGEFISTGQWHTFSREQINGYGYQMYPVSPAAGLEGWKRFTADDIPKKDWRMLSPAGKQYHVDSFDPARNEATLYPVEKGKVNRGSHPTIKTVRQLATEEDWEYRTAAGLEQGPFSFFDTAELLAETRVQSFTIRDPRYEGVETETVGRVASPEEVFDEEARHLFGETALSLNYSIDYENGRAGLPPGTVHAVVTPTDLLPAAGLEEIAYEGNDWAEVVEALREKGKTHDVASMVTDEQKEGERGIRRYPWFPNITPSILQHVGDAAATAWSVPIIAWKSIRFRLSFNDDPYDKAEVDPNAGRSGKPVAHAKLEVTLSKPSLQGPPAAGLKGKLLSGVMSGWDALERLKSALLADQILEVAHKDGGSVVYRGKLQQDLEAVATEYLEPGEDSLTRLLMRATSFNLERQVRLEKVGNKVIIFPAAGLEAGQTKKQRDAEIQREVSRLIADLKGELGSNAWSMGVTALGEIGEPAVSALLGILQSYPTPLSRAEYARLDPYDERINQRVGAIYALAEVKTPKAIPLFRRRLQDRKEHERVRFAVVHALRQFDPKTRGIVSILKLAQKDPSPEIQEEAVEISQQIRHSRLAAGLERVSRLDAIKERSIADLEDLSARAINSLEINGITTVGDILNYSDQELLSIRNFSETSLREIVKALGKLGIVRPPSGRKFREGISLEALGLSFRAREALRKSGIKTAGDLQGYSADQLLEQRNFGIASLHEVQGKLAAIGLSLLGEKPEEFLPRKPLPKVPSSAVMLPGVAQQPEVASPIITQVRVLPASDISFQVSTASLATGTATVKDWSQVPVEDLGLSVRASMIVEQLGVKSVSDLTAKTAEEIMKVKGTGITALNEIRQRLGERGLRLQADAGLEAEDFDQLASEFEEFIQASQEGFKRYHGTIWRRYQRRVHVDEAKGEGSIEEVWAFLKNQYDKHHLNIEFVSSVGDGFLEALDRMEEIRSGDSYELGQFVHSIGQISESLLDQIREQVERLSRSPEAVELIYSVLDLQSANIQIEEYLQWRSELSQALQEWGRRLMAASTPPAPRGWPGAVLPEQFHRVSLLWMQRLPQWAGDQEGGFDLEEAIQEFRVQISANPAVESDQLSGVPEAVVEQILDQMPSLLGAEGEEATLDLMEVMTRSAYLSDVTSVIQGLLQEETLQADTDPNEAAARIVERMASRGATFGQLIPAELQAELARRTFEFLRTPAAGLEGNIESIGLPVDVEQKLMADGINTMKKFRSISWEWFLKHPRIGPSTIQRVKRVLDRRGVMLPQPKPIDPSHIGQEPIWKLAAFSLRAKGAFLKLNIETVDDLRRKSADDFLEVGNVWITTITEIKEALAPYQLELRGQGQGGLPSEAERTAAIDRVRTEFAKITPVPGAALVGIGPSQAAQHAKLLRAMGQILDPSDPTLSSIRQRLFVVTKPEEPLLHIILQENLGIVANNSPLSVAEELRKRFRSVEELKASYLVAMGMQGAAEQQALNDAMDLDEVRNPVGPKIKVVPQTTREDLKDFLQNLLATLAGMTLEQVPDRFNLDQLTWDIDLLIKA